MGGCYGWLLWVIAMGGCYGWLLYVIAMSGCYEWLLWVVAMGDRDGVQGFAALPRTLSLRSLRLTASHCRRFIGGRDGVQGHRAGMRAH